MRISICSFCVLIWLCVFSFSAYGSNTNKIVVVDLQRVIAQSIEGKKAMQKLKQKEGEIQKKVNKKQETLLKLKDELEKKSLMLSMDAKEDKNKNFERQTREYKYFIDDLTQEMRKYKLESQKKILEELSVIIQDVGKKNSYKLIVGKRAGAIYYNDPGIDITDDIIKAYDISRQ